MSENYSNTLAVCYFFDNGYAGFAGVSLQSLLESISAGVRVHAYLLTDGLDDENLARFDAMVQRFPQLSYSHHDVRTAENYAPVNSTAGWKEPTYFRLYLDKFALHQRVLLIDCDTLVLRDISALIAVDLEGHSVGAVVDDVHDIEHISHPIRQRDFGDFTQGAYFNAGMMLVDIERACDQELFGKALKICHKKRDLLLPDQDALNLVLNGDWKRLDRKFNVMVGAWRRRAELTTDLKDDFKRAFSEPKILHYTGAKPWSSRDYMPYKREFTSVQKRSEWASEAPASRMNLARWFQYQLRKIGRAKLTKNEVVLTVGWWRIVSWQSAR